ncbi:MAG: hypothetical protein GC206_13340 [Alphaproteobacteria bacterium]|nr:hypothetical protein [Alphaproteobacteria bacterium]
MKGWRADHQGIVAACACGTRGEFLCDWKTPAADAPRCARALCAACAVSPDFRPDKHLCAVHAKLWRSMNAARDWRPAEPAR